MEAEAKKKKRAAISNGEVRFAYTAEEIVRLSQEIMDGTVHDSLLELFTSWIRCDNANYEHAKKYIRELGLDRDYQTARITNDKLRKLVDDVWELRPRYEPPPPEEGPDLKSMMEILQDAPASPEKKKAKQSLSIRTSLASLRSPLMSSFKKSGILRSHADDFNKGGQPLKSPLLESLMFESQLESPIGAPLQVRPASSRVVSAHGLKKPPSSSAAASTTTRSSSQEYPPDTPDRPAPLKVKSRTEPRRTSQIEPTAQVSMPRSVSTPVRKSQRSPLPPPPTSPPPPIPLLPLHLAPGMRETSRLFQRIPPEYLSSSRSSLSSPRRNRAARNVTFASEEEDDFDPYMKYPFKSEHQASSDSVSEYSQNPMDSDPLNKMRVEPRQVSLVPEYAVALASEVGSYPGDDDDRSWETIEQHYEYPESKDVYGLGTKDSGKKAGLDRNSGSKGEYQLALTNLGRKKRGDSPSSPIAQDASATSIPDTKTNLPVETAQRLDRPDPQDRTVRKGIVTSAERRAAKQAMKDARDANLAAMHGFHRPLPLRSYESQAFTPMVAKGAGDHARSSSVEEVGSVRNRTPLLPMSFAFDSSGVSGFGVGSGGMGGRAEVGQDGTGAESKKETGTKNEGGIAVQDQGTTKTDSGDITAIDDEDEQAAQEGEDLVMALGPVSRPSLPGIVSDALARSGQRRRNDNVDLSLFPSAPNSNVAPDDTALDEAWHVLSTAVIQQRLQKTRQRGARLPRVDPQTLSDTTIQWRRENEGLLKTVYGRTDMELNKDDVRLVNKIARALREGDGWLRRAFQ